MNLLARTGSQLQLKWRLAFTLTEVMVASAAGALVLGAAAVLSGYGNQSFVAINNYMDLDRCSRNALDQLSRDIRQTVRLNSFATNRLDFTDADGNPITFAWSPSTRLLTRTKNGATTNLLTECDYLAFAVFQRNPIPFQYNFYPATNQYGTNDASLAKLVNLSWRCSRTILGRKLNTESVQTAKIVLRN
jgi:hypothetical protein